MAIAYFIPDQAKLLAGQRSSRASNNSSSTRSSSNNQPTATATQNNNASNTEPVNGTVNRGYGTTINISVPNFSNTAEEPLGCWDFLTQLFCHTLRFYHESSQLQPTVIQISVNFNAQTNTTTTTATTSTETAAATTTNSSQTSTNESSLTTDNNNTPGDKKQKKFSKRKN